MATLSEVGPSSFDAYEGIRIVIPGLLTYGVVAATFCTLAPSERSSLLVNPLTGVVGALAIGLLLYFLDIPARAAAYSKNQPTDYLKKQFPQISAGELRTAYFLLLNTRMPANTRNRALYMGSMYRIGVEMILALAIATSGVFGAALFDYGPTRDPMSSQAHRWAAIFLIVVFALAFWANAAYGPAKAGERLKSFVRGLRVWSIVLYCFGLVLVPAPVLAAHCHKAAALQHRYVALAGLALTVAYWLRRYVRGDLVKKDGTSSREPMDSSFAGFLFLLPMVVTLCLYEPGAKNITSSASYLVGWSAAAGLVIGMVTVRGHERKLHGVYIGQTRWMKDNSDDVSKFLGAKPKDVEASAQPLRLDIAVADVKLSSPEPKFLAKLKRLLSQP